MVIRALVGLAAVLAGPAWAQECSPALTATNKKLVQDFVDAARHGGVGLRERAEKFLTPRYIQHHPGVASGREPFIQYHIKWYQDNPVPAGGPRPLAAVVAKCDLVAIMHHRPRPDPDHPGRSYDSFSFDMWRIKDGKIDEHWDNAQEVWRPQATSSQKRPPATIAPATNVPIPAASTARVSTQQCDPKQIEHNEELIRILGRTRHKDRAALLAMADQILAENYIQRNPIITDQQYQGLAGYIRAVDRILKLRPGGDPSYGMPDFIFADCNYVVGAKKRIQYDRERPGTTFDSYWFDLWRVEDGKLAEHWDPTLKGFDYRREEVEALNPKRFE